MSKQAQEIVKYLVVGRQVTIQPEPHKGTRTRHRSAIRGWNQGGYIVLDTPPGAEAAVALTKDLTCAIRFMNEGRAFAFYTRIIESVTKNSPFLRVYWPRELQGVQVRRHERIKLKIPCRLTLGEGQIVQGEARDLSLGGCRILCQETLPAESSFNLDLQLPDGSSLDGAMCIVRSASQTQDGVFLGCEFTQIDERSLHDIDFFVSNSFQRLREPSPQSVNVLFIGSETSELTPLKQRLEALNCEVCIAASTVDGMFRLRLVPPLAVMIDRNQQDLPGTEICRVLRKTRGLETLPIFIFGGDDPAGSQACREAGATRYFRSLKEMYQVLESIVREYASFVERPDDSES